MIDYNAEDRTFDCPPSLSDEQVVDFCRDGYLLLRGVVPDETNRRTIAWLNGERPAEPVAIPPGMTADDLQRIRASHEPSSIFLEEWFLRDVLLNEQLVGVMRSLLGRSVQLPVLASHHGTQCPQPAQGWHHDADRVFGPELNFVEVFYFPQDTPIELGPTELVPGTHMRHTPRRAEEGGLFSDGPAGTLGIHHQSILHRRGASTASGMRHMLKYNYWRTTPPQRDWIHQREFDERTAHFGGHEQARYAAHMYYWLCGRGDAFRTLGGQAWPWRSANQIGPSPGFAPSAGYRPDWSGSRPDGYAP
jgi:hypothetical protein